MGGGPTDGPELGGQWKGWGDGVMSALLCLESSIRILRAATGKMRKPFGHDLGVGGRKRGKLRVMPRFQQGDSSLVQLQAECLLQCCPLGSRLHSGKTEAPATPEL